MEHVEDSIRECMAALDPELRKLSLEIHHEPELGHKEFKAYQALTAYLETKGFHVQREACGLETGFIAEYSNGEGRRVGFCSEYDALPGIGHGCGHNLIAIAGVACAVAVKRLLEQHLIQGTVVLFGTPAEETDGGKITFVTQGEFQRRVDFAMMLHPFANDTLYTRMLALDALRVEMIGKASHAGMAPWMGINAVDGLMQGWNSIAMLRQQILPTDRIHGIITQGGSSANVIPDFASAEITVRSVTRQHLAELKEKVHACFEAAALATGCQLVSRWDGVWEDVFANDTLTRCYKEAMEEHGVIFLPRWEEEREANGSTDMGNVSYVIPTIHPGFSIGTDAANHTAEFTRAAKTPEAHRRTLRASSCLTKTAARIFLDPALYSQMWHDFKQR